MFDVIIRGGDVIDGTGGPRRRCDVGVEGDRVAALGQLDGPARRVIDATGLVVTPGFVDVHTHLDAQVFWDGGLTPSPMHGVTSVFAGNCGFTIAPLSQDPADADYLLRMLARVEGMPPEALRQGVPWDWTSTAEYLDALEGRLGINAGFMVGHSAVRRVAMGSAATAGPADHDQVAAMCRLVHEGLEAGAVGFSSSMARTHNDADGAMVPSRHATPDEMLALCRAVGDHAGTSLELVPGDSSRPFQPWARELMRAMSTAARRTLNWNVLFVRGDDEPVWRSKLAAFDDVAHDEGRVVALTLPVNNGFRLTFRSGFVFDAVPGWEPVMLAPYPDRLAMFRDPEVRARLGDLAARDHAMAQATDWAGHVIFDTVAPENEPYQGCCIGDLAADQGRTPWEVLCEIVLADELNTSFGTSAPDETEQDWQARLEVWRDPRAVIGASDAGAHLDLLDTFLYPSRFLGRAVRQRGLLSLEEAVHLLTDRPASLYGLQRRGRIERGAFADLVVLDEHRIGDREVTTRFDLPGGAGRLYAEADGIEHVLCNGEAIIDDGRLTSARPGRVLRGGRDTVTP